MAVEDFPTFPRWVSTLDKLVEAKNRLLAAIKDGKPDQDLVAARRDVTLAQNDFDSASWELENDA